MPIGPQQPADHFVQHFGQSPQGVVRAPGRVNLIGEHTDYNDGFVLPMAIDRAAWIAFRPRADRRVVVHSIDYQQANEFDLDQLSKGEPGWIEYFKGVAWSLQQAGHQLQGWEGVMLGDVPLGAGLSSSAALELAVARTFAAVGNFAWDAVAMARLGQKAENEWVGMRCGIMDQLISAAGQDGHALLIDCRSLEIQPVPLPSGVVVVVLDTGTRRGLVDSAYNERRQQCEAVAERFGVRALRDVSSEQLQKRAGELDATMLQRARHVVSEDERTLEAVQAMRRGDVATLGALMKQSHISLRDDFQVSSDALNAMVEIALVQPGCYGARMTGAGFGGCAMALVEANAAEAFAKTVAAKYQCSTGHTPAVYVCCATDGARLVAG